MIFRVIQSTATGNSTDDCLRCPSTALAALQTDFGSLFPSFSADFHSARWCIGKCLFGLRCFDCKEIYFRVTAFTKTQCVSRFGWFLQTVLKF